MTKRQMIENEFRLLAGSEIMLHLIENVIDLS